MAEADPGWRGQPIAFHGHADVRRIEPIPGQRVLAGQDGSVLWGEINDGQPGNGEQTVVERENPQRSADVEGLEIGRAEFRIDEDAGDQEAAKNEEQVHAEVAADEARAYHATQLGWLATTDVDMITALTFTQSAEAIGVNFVAMLTVLGGLALLFAFVLALGLHVSLRIINSRLAIVNTLGTVFFLSVGTLIAIYLIVIGLVGLFGAGAMRLN